MKGFIMKVFMKKYLLLLLVFLLVFSFCGCQKQNDFQADKSSIRHETADDIFYTEDYILYRYSKAGGKISDISKLMNVDYLTLSDEWCVFYNSDKQLVKYNIAAEKTEIISTERLHNLMLIDNQLYYIRHIENTGTGDIICMNINDNSTKTIARTCLFEGLSDRKMFFDVLTKKDIYFWTEDGTQLLKYNIDTETTEVMFNDEKASQQFCDCWIATNGIIYNYKNIYGEKELWYIIKKDGLICMYMTPFEFDENYNVVLLNNRK